MLLSCSTLPYLQYIYITFRDCVYYVSQEEERMVLANSDLVFLTKEEESWIKLFFTFTLVLYLE